MNSTFHFNRIVSFGIDLLFISCLQIIFGRLTIMAYRWACHQYAVPSDIHVESFLSQFSGAFFFLSYFTVALGLFGNTLGKSLTGLQIIHDKSGTTLTLSQAYWRSMAYYMSIWTYMLGFLLSWFRRDKKTLHDLLCGTSVINKKQNGTGKKSKDHEQLEFPIHKAA